MRVALSAAAVAAWAAAAMAQDTAPPALPESPERIVSLSDPLLTLPLHELGLTPVGAAWQSEGLAGDKKIYALEDLFGVTGTELGITPVYTGSGLDIEQIRLLDPDLIVATEYEQDYVPQLQRIAPVHIHPAFTREAFGLDGTRKLARELGRDDQLEALEERYNKRVSALKTAMRDGIGPEERSYAVLLHDDQAWLFTGAGATHEVLDDLGFTQPEWVIEASGETSAMALSSEALPRLDVDLLIVMPKAGDRTETDTRASLDRIAPGWHLLFEPEQLLFAASDSTLSTTFAAAHVAIDQIAAHFDLSLPDPE